MMRQERHDKFKRVAACRQPNLTVVLENVHDPHNIGAVLRTCDSVGIKEIFVLNSRPDLDETTIIMGKRTSAGARKWVNVNYYTKVEYCFNHIKKQYDRILATQLGTEAESIYQTDLTQSIALVFGNEKFGISEDTLKYTDGNIVIPQVGMVESLNISVACAVSLYEAYRQRYLKGFYTDHPQLSEKEQAALYEDYVQRSENKLKGAKVKRQH